jgi:hypothetical protein
MSFVVTKCIGYLIQGGLFHMTSGYSLAPVSDNGMTKYFRFLSGPVL